MPPTGPNVGLGVFVFRSRQDLRFVFGRRKGSLGEGTYSLTGGHLELGETFEQGAKREVMEETGVEIENVKFLTAVENFFEEKGGRHYITLFVTASLKPDATTGGDGLQEPQNLEPEKCEGWEWWTVTQLRERYETDPSSLFLPMSNLYQQRPETAEKLERGEIT